MTKQGINYLLIMNIVLILLGCVLIYGHYA